MLVLTFWTDPPNKNDPDDFDGLLEVRLKSVKQIPDLLASMPTRCTMVSTEYSGTHLNRAGKPSNPQNPKRFKEIWRKGQPLPSTPKPATCPLCGSPKGH